MRMCPECRHLWSEGIGESASVHIALVGGKAVGKTSYLMTALRKWRRAEQAPVFIDTVQEEQVKDRWRLLLSGEEIEPTREVTPPACMLKIPPAEQEKSKLLYLYDPGGEAFESDILVSKQAYYQYVDGIIFLIDACSLVGEPQKRREQVLKVSQTYERMLVALETHAGLSKRKGYSMPVAVVVSKMDKWTDEERWHGEPQALHANAPHLSMTGEQSQQVRALLSSHGLENLVRGLEQHFVHVRYFACSALGRRSSSNERHEMGPERALEPLQWVLKQRSVL